MLSDRPESRKIPVVVKLASPASAASTPVDGAMNPTVIAVSNPAASPLGSETWVRDAVGNWHGH